MAAIQYRTFRNPDPPALVQVWNEALTTRGAAFLQGTTPLEYYVLAKSYFDPLGLLIAEDRGKVVGFALAGFGPDEAGERLSPANGVVCAVVVRPKYRGKKIGSELLQRAEEYLRGKGAQAIYFGAMRPLNPFLLGVYGGSELPGVLKSDATAEPFLVANHYEAFDSCVVLNRSLDGQLNVNDARFATIRRRFEVRILPRPTTKHWFNEVVVSPLEVLQFQLVEMASKLPVAQACVWDMDLFGWRWHQPAAGITDVEVHPNMRRQGFGKYLMVQIVRYLQDQFFALVEVQAMAKNAAALGLYQGLGFKQVDEGKIYRLTAGT